VLVVVLGLGLGGCGGGDDASVASFCTAVKKDNEMFKNVSGTTDAIHKASAALKDLVDKSPSGVKDDVKTLSDGFEKAASGKITSAKADTAKYTAASKRVVAYTKQECGFDLDAG
jgi:hypothetical protein